MKYKCKICGFETDIKSQIHFHHIIPRQAKGSNSKWNLVTLCARCHPLIYSPLATKGIHSIKHPQSIQIVAWRQSSAGLLLQVIFPGNITKFIK